MKLPYIPALFFVSLGLAACGQNPDTPTDAFATPTVAPAGPVTNAVDNLAKNVFADGVMFQPEAAKVDGDAIVSTGNAGFMMFGPYVAFLPGVYHVTVKGSIPSLESGAELRFDAVSAAATTVHGEHVVNAAIPATGNIAEFDITIPEAVVDLELRANVTPGAVVRIESYEIVKAN